LEFGDGLKAEVDAGAEELVLKVEELNIIDVVELLLLKWDELADIEELAGGDCVEDWIDEDGREDVVLDTEVVLTVPVRAFCRIAPQAFGLAIPDPRAVFK
jgi:hypothetical protein